ncbi:hypothetical protein KJ708_02030 [bacterium]|nr:hypothetical protein [bacterium]MBU1918196.1 hypothetical protein [bacterium]
MKCMTNYKIKNTLILIFIIFLSSACTGSAVDIGGTLFGGSMLDETIDGTGEMIPGSGSEASNLDETIPTGDIADTNGAGTGAGVVCLGANCVNNDSEDEIDPTSGEYIDGNTEVVSIPAPPPMEEDNEEVVQDGNCENEDETDSVVERCAYDQEQPEAMQSRGSDMEPADVDLSLDKPSRERCTDEDGEKITGDGLLGNLGGRNFRGHDNDDDANDDGFARRTDPTQEDDEAEDEDEDESAPQFTRGYNNLNNAEIDLPQKECQPTVTTYRCTRNDNGDLTWQEIDPLSNGRNVLVLEYFNEDGDLDEEVVDFSGKRGVDTSVFTRPSILKGEPQVFIRNTQTGEEEETTVRVRNPQAQKTPSGPAILLNNNQQQNVEEEEEEEEEEEQPSRSFTPNINFSAPVTTSPSLRTRAK